MESYQSGEITNSKLSLAEIYEKKKIQVFSFTKNYLWLHPSKSFTFLDITGLNLYWFEDHHFFVVILFLLYMLCDLDVIRQ